MSHLDLCHKYDVKKKFRSGGGGGGIVAKDAFGNDVIATEWLKNHGPGDRTLTQGLKVSKLVFQEIF